MTGSDPDDKSVVGAVQDDEEALTALLERCGPPIRDALRISAKHRHIVDPDDVMQVTYLEAFLSIHSFTPSTVTGFERWLRRIAENNLRDAIKTLERVKRPRISMDSGLDDTSCVALVERVGLTTTTAAQAATACEIRQEVDSALRLLPPVYEQVLRLYELEGRPLKEIAALLGRSVGAIKMLLSRARERLRDSLGSSSRYFG